MASTYKDSYIHTAAAGETWDILAYNAYGVESMASLIWQANPRLGSLVVFEGGEQITIPIVEKAQTPQSLPPWRR